MVLDLERELVRWWKRTESEATGARYVAQLNTTS